MKFKKGDSVRILFKEYNSHLVGLVDHVGADYIMLNGGRKYKFEGIKSVDYENK